MITEKEISEFMLRASKFEFFLMNQNIELGRIEEKDGLQKLTGVQWEKLAAIIEEKHKFHVFDFGPHKFSYFINDVPQYLIKTDEGIPDWDSDEAVINS